MAAVSNPSSRTTQKQRAKISHWKRENGCSLRKVWTSTLRSGGMSFASRIHVALRDATGLQSSGVGCTAQVSGRPT